MKITATLKKTNLNNYQSVTLQRYNYSTIITNQRDVAKLKCFFNLEKDGDTNTVDVAIVLGCYHVYSFAYFIKENLKDNIIIDKDDYNLYVCDKRTAIQKGWLRKKTVYDNFNAQDGIRIEFGSSTITELMIDLVEKVDNKTEYLYGFVID